MVEFGVILSVTAPFPVKAEKGADYGLNFTKNYLSYFN